jgi:hypothetical protein
LPSTFRVDVPVDGDMVRMGGVPEVIIVRLWQYATVGVPKPTTGSNIVAPIETSSVVVGTCPHAQFPASSQSLLEAPAVQYWLVAGVTVITVVPTQPVPASIKEIVCVPAATPVITLPVA